MATLAVSIAPSSAAARGATARTTPAALAGGMATITALAAIRSACGTGPHSSANPSGVRRIERTVTPVRTVNRPDAASASGNRPTPPRIAANTGPDERRAAIPGDGPRCGNERTPIVQPRSERRQRRA